MVPFYNGSVRRTSVAIKVLSEVRMILVTYVSSRPR